MVKQRSPVSLQVLSADTRVQDAVSPVLPCLGLQGRLHSALCFPWFSLRFHLQDTCTADPLPAVLLPVVSYLHTENTKVPEMSNWQMLNCMPCEHCDDVPGEDDPPPALLSEGQEQPQATARAPLASLPPTITRRVSTFMRLSATVPYGSILPSAYY